MKYFASIVIIFISTTTIIAGSETDLIDDIIKIVNNRWEIGFDPSSQEYWLKTKEKFNVTLSGGNNSPFVQNIQVMQLFKIYKYESDLMMLKDRKEKFQEFDRLVKSNESIPHVNQMGWLNFDPRNGTEWITSNQIRVLQLFTNGYPTHRYKPGIYIALTNWSGVYAGDENSRDIASDIDRIERLWVKVLE